MVLRLALRLLLACTLLPSVRPTLSSASLVSVTQRGATLAATVASEAVGTGAASAPSPQPAVPQGSLTGAAATKAAALGAAELGVTGTHQRRKGPSRRGASCLFCRVKRAAEGSRGVLPSISSR
jgi:hypothetical protein